MPAARDVFFSARSLAGSGLEQATGESIINATRALLTFHLRVQRNWKQFAGVDSVLPGRSSVPGAHEAHPAATYPTG